MKRYRAWIGIGAALVAGLAVGFAAGRHGDPQTYDVPAVNRCGPDALSAALADLSIEAPADRVAKIAGTDGQGTTMLGLKEAAEAFGAKAVGLRLSQQEMESYFRKGAEVVAFVNGDHYVWVKNVHPRGVVIKDPSQPGFQFIPLERWHAMWMGDGGKERGRGVCLVVYPKSG
jgi:ABC-type bacteriocin/lantibiotic exporter with double-glycine peptidase domain